jgi:hypothetical protein
MAPKSQPIRTDVSPALRYEIISHREAALSGRSKLAYVAAQDALWHLYENQGLTMQAKKEAMAAERTPSRLRDLQMVRDGKMKPTNGMVLKGAQIELALRPAEAKALNEAIELGFRRTMAVQVRATKTITDELEMLHSERAARSTDPNSKTPQGISAAAEIRAHIKSLPVAERAELVREQIAAGNARVASAVADAEPFLSGLDSKTHANLVSRVHEKFSAEETTKIEALNAVLKTVADAGSLVLAGLKDNFEPVIGQDATASAALSALKSGETS